MPSAPACCANLHAFLALLLLATAGGQDAGIIDISEVGDKEHREVSERANSLRLNAHTFHGNVFHGGDHIEQWVVSFCPNWWEPCQNLALPFDQFGLEWERKLNTELLTKKVRFATVDCATEKVLCNEQGVQQYPTVHHYQEGQIASTWVGGRSSDAETLAKFLRKHLRRVTEAPPPTEAKALEHTSTDGLVARLAPGDCAIDFVLIVFVLSLNTWAVFNNPQLWQKSQTGACEEPALASKQPGPAPTPAAHPAVGAAAARREGVVRFMPEEWREACSSMEL